MFWLALGLFWIVFAAVKLLSHEPSTWFSWAAVGLGFLASVLGILNQLRQPR